MYAKPHHLYFNPRAREGRDDTSPGSFSQMTDFNPRAREGRDLKSISWQNLI